jgi:hypothetical protein
VTTTLSVPSSPKPHAGVQRFAILWGLALLHHQLGYDTAWTAPLDLALTIAAAVLIVVPRLVVLALTAAVHLLVVGEHLPAVYNHWWFTAWISAAVLLAMPSTWRAAREARVTAPAAFDAAFSAPARLSLMLLYLLAGFHKLNTDFLTPGVSCGTVLTTQLGATFGVHDLGAPLGMVAAALTLVAELGLPILLLFSRTRAAGVLGALGFHLAMALAGYPRFSSAGLALLVLFLPTTTRFPWIGRVWATPASRMVTVAALVVAQWLAPAVASALLLLLLVGITAAFAAAVWLERRCGDWTLPRGRVRWAQLAPACVFLIGCLPYLGLGTDRTWGMYSNLRVEGGTTNHLIVPATSQRFGFQRDLVAVKTSSAPGLQSLATHGQVVPWVEFRARVAEAMVRAGGQVGVTYVRAGRMHQVDRVADDSLLARPVSIWHRKLWRFRPVEAVGPRACTV